MRMRQALGGAFAAAIAMAFFTASAGEWYVDDEHGNDDTGTGSSASPYKTIQKAVDSASADDTVYVLPGVYDEGTKPGLSWSYKGVKSKQATRVVVDKRLDFIGVGGRDKVTILGDYGDPNLALAYRTNSVACILVETAASGSTFTGFTLKDGNSHQSSGDDALASGGICSRKTGEVDFTVIGCRIEHCFGRGGGAMTGGVAVRTVFENNRTSYLGAALYRSKAFNCLFLCNSPTGGNGSRQDLYDSIAVNCLCIGNRDKQAFAISGAAEGMGLYYNTAAYDTYAACTAADGTGYNCVIQGVLGGDSVNVRSLDYTVYTNLCVNAYTGDYRPVKGGLLDGTGDSQHLAFDWIPTAERTRDFFGNERPSGAATPIGLLLEPEEVRTGVLKISSAGLTVEGLEPVKVPAFYQCTNAWPCQVEIGLAESAPTNTLGFQLGGVTVDNARFVFGRREKVWQTMPRKQGFSGVPMPAVELTRLAHSGEWHVDCNAEYEGEADGSAEKPYKTLQSAVDALPNDKWILVHVAQGHYDKGGTVDANGVSNRVVVTGKKFVAFVADDGPEKTFIEGSADPNTADGCGTAAMRCLYSSASSCSFSGFTFMNGHTWTNNANHNTACYIGGAVYTDFHTSFVGCTFTGNRGTVAVACGGRFENCVATNNSHYSRGLFTGVNCLLSACKIAGNASKDWGNSYVTFFEFLTALNCSVHEPVSVCCNTYNINCRVINCAFLTGGHLNGPNSDGTVIGCVGTSVSSSATIGFDQELNLKADPLFASPRCGNLHPFELSPTVGYCTLPDDPTGKVTLDTLTAYLRADMDGNRLVRVDGSLNAGCYVETVPALAGVYVSPDGDDANDGFTESTPLKTLQVAVDLAKDYGAAASNTVIALPGTYDVGAKCHTGSVFAKTPTVRSRVLVPAGVTLRSRDGAAETIIAGAEAEETDETRDDYGRGKTAIRCVFLELDAKVKGFTLTNGHTDSDTSGYVDNNLGGGAFGRATARCSVEDCIVTGNHSPNGGAGSHVSFRRCDISGNYGTKYGAVIRTGSLYDCYAHGNVGNYMCDLFVDVVNCTFADNYAADGVGRTQLCCNGGSGQMANTVAFDVSTSRNRALGSTRFSNCIFQNNISMEYTDSNVTNDIDTSHTSAELAAMLSNGRPIAANLPMVDAGCDVGTSDGLDVAGTTRVKNGTIDIGAFEYDWRPDYSKALAKKGLTVTDVSTNGVVETADGIVTLTDGGVIEASRTDVRCDCTLGATLDGEGALIVKRNGVEVGRLTATGALKIPGDAASDSLEFIYEGEGSAALSRIKNDIGMLLFVR